jgi:hypothetical protein
MPRPRDSIRDFPGKRWLNLVLRGAHLIGIVLLGAGLLGSGHTALGASITFASGLGMFAIDTWANPAHLRETAGFGVLVKLALVGVMIWDGSYALPIFWALLLLSTLLSHAPGSFRHRQLF